MKILIEECRVVNDFKETDSRMHSLWRRLLGPMKHRLKSTKKRIAIRMHIHRLAQLLFVFILATGIGLPDHLQALVWILKAHITSSKMYALPFKQQGHKITTSCCHNTYYGIPCTSERYFLKIKKENRCSYLYGLPWKLTNLWGQRRWIYRHSQPAVEFQPGVSLDSF